MSPSKYLFFFRSWFEAKSVLDIQKHVSSMFQFKQRSAVIGWAQVSVARVKVQQTFARRDFLCDDGFHRTVVVVLVVLYYIYYIISSISSSSASVGSITVQSSVGWSQTGGVGQIDGVNRSVEHIRQNLSDRNENDSSPNLLQITDWQPSSIN